MLILGIESATTRVGCAIGGHEGVLASAHSSRGRRHAEALAPQIKFIAEQAGISLFEEIRCEDHSAITGLPLMELAETLRRLGVQVP